MQAIEPSLDAIQQLILDAPVSVVTLLEDRALVRRSGKANLTQGLWRIKVENVAPVLSDKSLRAEFCDEYPEARIDDVRVRRQMLVKQEERPEEIKALLEELRSLQNTFNYLSEDRQHQEYSFDQVNTVLAHSLQELPVDAAWGQIDPTTWRSQFQTLFRQLRELRSEILNSYHHQEKLSQQINDLITRIRAMSRPDRVCAAHIEADLMISQAGDYEIAFDYVVPNALWRPWHQARLLLAMDQVADITNQPSATSATSSVSFRVDGCVWQRTGEDWNNVDLVFSTARASLGTEPPLLTDDLLNVQEKSKQIIIEARNQTIQTTGLGTGAVPTRETPASVDLSCSSSNLPRRSKPARGFSL